MSDTFRVTLYRKDGGGYSCRSVEAKAEKRAIEKAVELITGGDMNKLALYGDCHVAIEKPYVCSGARL